jgi:hypothetical protein
VTLVPTTMSNPRPREADHIADLTDGELDAVKQILDLLRTFGSEARLRVLNEVLNLVALMRPRRSH